MWSKSTAFAASGLALALWMTNAEAVQITVDFEAFDGKSFLDPPSPFSEDGFDLDFEFLDLGEGNQAGFYFIDDEHPCASACVENGSTVFYQFNSSTLHLTHGADAPFSLFTLDAASAAASPMFGLFLQVIGILDGGGTVATTFSAAPGDASVFRTFTLPSTFTNLVSVAFRGEANYGDGSTQFALDNIVAEAGIREVEATPIPEPATGALAAMVVLALGLFYSTGAVRARLMG